MFDIWSLIFLLILIAIYFGMTIGVLFIMLELVVGIPIRIILFIVDIIAESCGFVKKRTFDKVSGLNFKKASSDFVLSKFKDNGKH